MPDQISDIYKAAIKRYEEITDTKLDDPSITTVTTVADLKNTINAKNKEFASFREKRHGLFSALSTAMRPIELFGDLAAKGASMVFPPSTLVFGAISYLVDAANGVSAKYDAIVDLLETLQNFTVRLQVYKQEQISKILGVKLADVLATLIDVLALSRKEIKSGRILAFGKFVLTGKNPKIDNAVDRLAKLTESEALLVGAETLTEVKQSGRTLNGVFTTLNTTSATVTQMSGDISQVGISVSYLNQKFEAFLLASDDSAAEIKDSKRESMQERVKAVLRPSVSALDWYDKINKSRVTGTGNWIREEPLFRSWLNKEMPVLWIAGNPGAGKSYIASNIISFLKEQYPQGVHHTSNVSVAYFFFKDDQPGTRSFDQALRDIAYQISQNDPTFEKYIAATCDSAQDAQSLHSIWRTLFTGYFLKNTNTESCVFIVLDGMDESYVDSREQFLGLTKDLQDASDARIQIAMLGRPQLAEEFEMAADMAQVPTIYVSVLNNSDDIVTYIMNSIKKSTYLKRAPESFQAEIVEKLSRGAQGMFIWVDFMLKELLKKRNEGAIRAALNTAPRGLNEMIRHVLEGFSLSLRDNTDAADDLNTLLAWVTCAQRPLTLGQLDTLLKVKSSTGDGNWWLEGTLRIQFASFFMLTREDGLATADLQRVRAPHNDFEVGPSDETSTEGFDDVENDTDFDSDPSKTEVTFCHASIGDFFRNDPEVHTVAGEDCPPIGMQYHEAKVSVLRTCLKVLSSEAKTDLWTRAADLRPYMCSFWIAALKAVDLTKTSKDDKVFIGTALTKLLSNEEILVNVVGAMGQDRFCRDNVELFAKWVTDSDVFDALPKKDQEWVHSTSERQDKLFLPWIRYIQGQWLQKSQWSAHISATIIYAYISLCAGDHCWNATWDQDIPDKINKAAEWCGLEQNALWHRRLAVALRDYNECDAAIPHFQKASELDPFMWIARGGEAICYMKRGTQEDYRRAIKLNRKTLETIEQLQPDETMTEATRNFHLHSVYERLADCLSKIDDINESVEACERAFTYNNRCYKCIRTILGAYHDAKRDEEVMKVLRSLNEPIEGLDYTRLSESLIQVGNYSLTDDYFTIFARAAFEWDEIPFAIEMYRNAAAAARKQQKPVQAAHLDLCLATLFDRYGHDSERAARIWERLVDTYHTTKGETEIAWTKFNASVRLARYCLKRSIEVGKGTKEAQRCGATLEKLAKVSVGSESAVAASNNATMLGAWYKLMGRDEDAHACFRVQVKEGIRMLSDNDPTNDFEAYWKLVSVLTVAGEEKTAMGLLWTMHEGQSDEDSEKEGDDHEREKKEEIDRAGNKSKSGIETKNEEKANRMSDDVLFICDGCLRPKRRVSIAICRYCYDTHFCQPCFALCKSAKLRVNICSSKHSWLVIEPRSDEERQANVAGMIRVEGENITVGELKRRLAAQWDL